MKKNSQDVTDTELSILQVLWKEKTATVRFIAEQLYGDSAKSQHATVQKLLDRLKTKGFVARDRTVWPHVFRAAVQSDELLDRRLQVTADKFFGGSIQPLLTHLLSGRTFSDEERSTLRKLLDESGEEG